MNKFKIFIITLFLTSFLTSNVLAEKFILECKTKYRVKQNQTEPLKRFLFRYVFDLENEQYTEPGLEGVNSIIVRENDFLEYFLSPSFGGGFDAQIIIWDRLNGERKAFHKEMTIETWKTFKVKLDKVNSKINNYEKDLDWGDESYSVSKLGSREQEIEKFEIIKNYIDLNNYALWQCEKANKAF